MKFIIIPAYNADQTIGRVLQELNEIYPEFKKVVVDDGSSDATADIVGRETREGEVYLLRNSGNCGYGASVQNGVRFALSQGAEVFVTMGADAQRDPKDIDQMVQMFIERDADVLIGSKFLGIGNKMPKARTAGNRIVTALFNLLFGSSITDVTSGFRVFNKRIAVLCDGLAANYSFDVDLYSEAVLHQLKVEELGVRVFYHRHSTRMRSTTLVGASLAWKIIRKAFYFRVLSPLTASVPYRALPAR